MKKTILLTGATDGIGLATARMLVSEGQHVLLHGRNSEKLEKTEKELSELPGDGSVESFVADLSRMNDVEALANDVTKRYDTLDVLINNAGVYNAPDLITQEGLDLRFVVNTLAPYLLTKRLLPLLGVSGSVLNISSAAQSPVNPEALAGHVKLSNYEAYAQSKVALTIWSQNLAFSLKEKGPAICSVNPGSLLDTKLVKEAFGIEGKDVYVGAEILTRFALADDFRFASGRYFDNDKGRFVPPHRDALILVKSEKIMRVIEETLAKIKQ